MTRPAPADIPEIYAQQPQPGFDPFGDLMVLRGIQPDMSGMDFIYPSGVNIGAIDIPDAVTLLSQADQNAMAALQAEARKVLDQEKAAQTYADLVLRQPTTAKDIAAVQEAKQDLVDLGVTREQIEAQGIDTSQGISGVMGPTISGAISQGIEKGSELFGLGAEGLAKLVGADEALSGVFAHVPGPGVTFVFDQKGQPPFVTGQTPTGTQVGITDPYGITAILEGLRQGDFDFYDAAGVLGTGAGGATSIAKAVQDEDAAKVGTETGVVLDIEGGVPSDIAGTGDVTRTPLPDADTQITRTSLPDADTQITRTSLPDTEIVRTALPLADEEIVRVLEDLGGRPAVPGGYDEEVVKTTLPEEIVETTEDRAATAATTDAGGAGGVGLDAGSGIRVVSGGPGPSVDIDYLYDIGGESIFAPTLEDEAEDKYRPYVYAEGGEVKRFEGGGTIATAQEYFNATNGNQSQGLLSNLTPTQTGLLGAAIGGLFGGLSGSGDTQGTQGYTGGIPALTAKREAVPGAFAMEGRRPGEAGRRYFTDVEYVPVTDTTGAPTVLGAEQLAAQNAAALARQQELKDLGMGILGLYGQRLAGTGDTDTTTPGTTTTPIIEDRYKLDIAGDTSGALVGTGPIAGVAETPKATTGNTLQDLIDLALADSAVTREEGLDVFNRALMLGASVDDLAAMSGLPATEIQDFIDLYGYGSGGGGLAIEGSEYDLYTPPGFAQGGNINEYYLGGPTDGMADKIPATINNIEPARLSDGEFVVPADVVSHLGNGNSDAGAEQLYKMMERVRKDRTGTPKQGRRIDPSKYLV